MITAGVVPLLVASLSSHQSAEQQAATRALCNLATGTQPIDITVLRTLTADSQQNRDAIVAAGVVPLLVALLGSDQPALQQQVSNALRCLTHGSQQIRDAIFAASAVPVLIALLRSDHAYVQAQAASTVISLVVKSRHSQGAVIAAGIVPLLVAFLTADQSTLQGLATCVLTELASGSQQSRDAIMAAGAVPLLLPLLGVRPASFANFSSSSSSSRALGRDLGSHQNKAAIVTAGVMPWCCQTSQMCKSL